MPVEWNGHIVLPLNTEIRGTLARVRGIGMGFSRETALLDFNFDTMIVPGGQPEPLSGQIVAVDNSRETVDVKGVIHGIRPTASPSKTLSGFAVSAAGLDPMSQMFAASASLSAFRIPEGEIIFPAGTELTFRIHVPLSVSQTFPGPAAFLKNNEQAQAMTELVRPLPFRTTTDKPVMPSDLISALYVGEKASIMRAFDAAGWVPSDPLSTQSKYGVMRSVIENQGYKEGPVSTLLLAGKPPDLVYSKTLDTFFARHHLRIYAQPGSFDGEPIWSSTATHDSGIGISKASKSLIHLIDENIDEERSKVVNDLLLTGCVDGVSYIDRPWVPRDAKNATGDSLLTDGRIAIVRINECADPQRADVPDNSLPKVKSKAPVAERIERDTVLYFRDDFFRGNIAYQGYSGISLLVKKAHKPPAEEQPAQKTVNVGGENYVVVSRPAVHMPKGGPRDASSIEPTFTLPGTPRSYATRLDYSISAGYSRFNQPQYSIQTIYLTTPGIPPPLGVNEQIAELTQLHTGWNIAPRVTLNSWRYVSNEFGYTYNSAALTITGKSSDPEFQSTYDYFDGQLRQFTYNALFHLRPNGKRFRPYAAVGPSFQLLRLTDSQPAKNSLLKFTIKDVGIIVGAYEFGSKPPLEGGGIFQFGLQYGGGFKYQVTPRFFIRSDFRETLSPQPDYWTKSYPTIKSFGETEGGGLFAFTIGPLINSGPLQHQMFTSGFGISF